MKRLSELNSGDIAIITRINSTGEYSKRLTEMGFVKDREIKVIKNAPLKDPMEYELMGYSISLRRSEANLIEVELCSDLASDVVSKEDGGFVPQISNDFGVKPERGDRVINVALIGNPNCGKTSLFNYMSGLDEHVGNYSGVTVDIKETMIKHKGFTINLTDLPGTYSLSSFSPEEKIVNNELLSNRFDYVINVVDSTLLERNLYLTTQLMDMGHHMVVALNMYDELMVLGDKFDHGQMGSMLDIPMIPTNARSGAGVDKLLNMVVSKYTGELAHTHVESNLGMFIEDRLGNLVQLIEDMELETTMPKRYIALRMIERDEISLVGDPKQKVVKRARELRTEIEQEYKDSIQQVLADARYGYIIGALKETLEVNHERNKRSQTIDSILTHKIWGFPIFLTIIWFMFYVTFTVGAYPQEWIDAGIGALGGWLNSIMSEGPLKDLVIDGIIGGVGSVIVFLPNIVLLFLFISILEDSGYMSRAAFIMDRLMHKIGLHGKSFVPLIMGFGCNVPAIMATRIIEDRNNRLLTALIVPFMSCSARLPVYILLIGAFFPEYPSLMLLAIYMFGILMAILSSIILKKVFFSGADHPFVMELPPYRRPMARNTLKHMWNKSGQYLKKMGGVILVGAVLIWALGYYPSREDSYLERVGHTIEPTIAPLGFDWKMGVSLITGVAAKEIVISTMGVLHNIEDDSDQSLQEQLKVDRYESGKYEGELIFTKPVTLSFLAFVLIYFPCLAVVAALKREGGGWKWAIISLVYTTGLAWIVSFIIYNVGTAIIG